MDPQVEPFINELVKTRRRKELSQAQLGQKLGMKQSYLSLIESGIKGIGLPLFLNIARALDLEVILVPKQYAGAVKQLVRELSGEISLEDDSAFVPTGDDDG